MKLDAEGEDFDGALARARVLTSDAPATIDGFEPLWLAAWKRYLAGDYAGALARFDAMALVYADISRSRRLAYWSARCLAVEGKQAEARAAFERLAAATPPDIYARFARVHAPAAPALERPALGDPSTATAAYARVDELLRLRMFEEASAEARTLLPSRGRDLRMAQADFALGHFPTAAIAIKRALPGDRHRRGGACARGLAAALLPDRGRRHCSPPARRRPRSIPRCCAVSCGRRASSTRARSRTRARSG